MVKLLIVGHGRHGKDTVCEMLRESYGLSFQSSSMFCAQRFIYEDMNNKLGYNYSTFEECYAARHQEREVWYNLISAYNKPDPSKLGREIFKEYSIYCGLRNKKEFHALKNSNQYDFAIWVDRSDYLPPEPKESNTIEPWMCDFVLDNNGSLDDLKFNVDLLMSSIVI